MTCLFVVVCPACPACHWGPSHLALWSAEFSSVLHFARLLGVRVFCLRLFAAGWCFCLVWFSPVGLGLVRFLGFLGLFVSLVWLRWFLLLRLRRLLLQPFVSALSTWGQLTSQSSHKHTQVVTGVFCQSAIDSAQNDHAAIVQSILENKDIAARSI